MLQIIHIRMQHGHIKIPYHGVNLPVIIPVSHTVVFFPDLNRHLALADKCAQIFIVILYENPDVLLNLLKIYL